MPYDLPDVYRDEDWPDGYQLDVYECVVLAEISAEINRPEIGSDNWIKQQVAEGKGTDERDARLKALTLLSEQLPGGYR